VSGLAIVGASQSGIPWTEWLIRSLLQYRYAGPIQLVNPRRDELLGRRCHPSVAALPEPPDIGVVAVGARHVAQSVADLIDAGATRIVVISNGFRETGTDEGRQRERDLVEACAGRDVVLVGPNCVGFASFHEGICAISQPVPDGIRPGEVSVVSQSGGLTAALMGAVLQEGLGQDVCYSIGNGAVFGLAAAVRSALARETTAVVCAAVESVDDAAGIEAAAAEAERAGKLLVFMTLGHSAGARQLAASHTGAVVGEQRLLAAWLRSIGVVLADSPEQVGRIARLFGTLGRPDARRGTFIATVSGGGAGLTGDLAARHGVRLATPTEATVERLRELLPAGAHIGNPLDVQTGESVAVYSAIAADENVQFLIEPWMLPWPNEELHWQRTALERIARIAGSFDVPLLVGSLFHQPLNGWAEDFGAQPGVCVTPDLELTAAALGKLYGFDGAPASAAGLDSSGSAATEGLVAEAGAREVLEAAGLPVVAGGVARDAAGAVELAARLRAPWVVKLSAADVGHKERIGGVRIGLRTADEVRAACEDIAASAREAGVTGEVAYLVSEMAFGPELLVGALRDPVAGASLTVAVGGWAAESGATFGTAALNGGPQAAELVRGWGLARLLGERRAGQLAEFLERLATAFVGGALARYATVEINPVMLTAEGPVIVDALLVADGSTA
jgi:acyl-CoA synthetase (NDP forming)